MKILFDHQIFILQNFGGISRYFLELAMALNRLQPNTATIMSPYFRNAQARGLSSNANQLFYDSVYTKLAGIAGRNAQLKITEGLLSRLAGQRGAVVHETYYTHRVATPAPKVTTVHDMIPEMLAEDDQSDKQLVAKKREAVEAASAVISVSEYTRSQLIERYPSVAGKTFVVSHGVHVPNRDAVAGFIHPRPYILFVGKRNWYKNFKQLVTVFAGTPELKNEFDIICCGGGAPGNDEIGLLKQLGVNGHVVFTSPGDNELMSLYKSARCLAYVSSVEGFGMPVLEAMAMGCPVLCTNTSSLPEVAGDAACQVDVNDPNALQRGLNAILFDEPTREKCIAAGIARAATFSWEKTAAETMKVYEFAAGA